MTICSCYRGLRNCIPRCIVFYRLMGYALGERRRTWHFQKNYTNSERKELFHRSSLPSNQACPDKLYQSGSLEFPIVKDTTPNITTPRLYGTQHTPKEHTEIPHKQQGLLYGGFLVLIVVFDIIQQSQQNPQCSFLQQNAEELPLQAGRPQQK